jgi:hypothetical protein
LVSVGRHCLDSQARQLPPERGWGGWGEEGGLRCRGWRGGSGWAACLLPHAWLLFQPSCLVTAPLGLPCPIFGGSGCHGPGLGSHAVCRYASHQARPPHLRGRHRERGREGGLLQQGRPLEACRSPNHPSLHGVRLYAMHFRSRLSPRFALVVLLAFVGGVGVGGPAPRPSRSFSTTP